MNKTATDKTNEGGGFVTFQGLAAIAPKAKGKAIAQPLR